MPQLVSLPPEQSLDTVLQGWCDKPRARALEKQYLGGTFDVAELQAKRAAARRGLRQEEWLALPPGAYSALASLHMQAAASIFKGIR